ncbi:MAG: putative DNA binding domain-containing protein [Rickettsiales bacterium]|nr:putative DNA binding domain-containing protein [Rickettsiales bacterium]
MQFAIDKDIKQITEDDLKNLVDNQRQEDSFLDFKRSPYGKTDTDKKELLKDVSAFANASGGEIIIGIEEDKYSQAKELCGFSSNNIAIEKNRMEQIIMNGLEPKFDNFKVRYINLKDNKYAIVIRIEHSPLFPHMVSLQRFNKFYMRKSDKNLLLDVYELRNLFLKSENFMQEIKKYNQTKIDNALNNNTLLPTVIAPKVLINFIPFDAFTRQTYLDLANSEIKINFPEQRINFDGLIAYQMNDRGINTYCQLHRNGIVEFLSSSNKMFDEIKNPFEMIPNLIENKLKVIYGGKSGYEYYLIRKSLEFLKILKNFRVQPPIYIFVSLVGAKGYRILYENSDGEKKITNAIDRNVISLPELELKDYNVDLKTHIRYIFDMIWNACGEKQSVNFNKESEWSGESIPHLSNN